MLYNTAIEHRNRAYEAEVATILARGVLPAYALLHDACRLSVRLD